MEVSNARALRCDVCGRIVSEPMFVKTCCNNKPKAFCSRQCYAKWRSEWLRNQEQLKTRGKGLL